MASLTADIATKEEFKYNAQAEAAAQRWIEKMLSMEPTTASFYTFLKSGVILCRLANAIQSHAVAVIYEGSLPYRQMENIGNYISACQQLGLREVELFETADLFTERNLNSVVNHIHVLAHFLAKRPGYAGPQIDDVRDAKSLFSATLVEDNWDKLSASSSTPLTDDQKELLAWANSKLRDEIPPVQLADLSSDVKNGVKLIKLLCAICRVQSIGIYNTNPTLIWHAMQNASAILGFVASQTFEKVDGVRSVDIVTGNVASVSKLLFYLRAKFDLEYLFAQTLGQMSASSISAATSSHGDDEMMEVELIEGEDVPEHLRPLMSAEDLQFYDNLARERKEEDARFEEARIAEEQAAAQAHAGQQARDREERDRQEKQRQEKERQEKERKEKEAALQAQDKAKADAAKAREAQEASAREAELHRQQELQAKEAQEKEAARLKEEQERARAAQAKANADKAKADADRAKADSDKAKAEANARMQREAKELAEKEAKAKEELERIRREAEAARNAHSTPVGHDFEIEIETVSASPQIDATAIKSLVDSQGANKITPETAPSDVSPGTPVVATEPEKHHPASTVDAHSTTSTPQDSPGTKRRDKKDRHGKDSPSSSPSTTPKPTDSGDLPKSTSKDKLKRDKKGKDKRNESSRQLGTESPDHSVDSGSEQQDKLAKSASSDKVIPFLSTDSITRADTSDKIDRSASKGSMHSSVPSLPLSESVSSIDSNTSNGAPGTPGSTRPTPGGHTRERSIARRINVKRTATFSTPVAPAADQEKVMRAQQVVRKHVATECLTTEQSYLGSLKTLIRDFLEPVKRSKVISPTEYASLFSNIEAIATDHEQFEQLLKNRIATWDDSSVLADIFLQHSAFFVHYGLYLENYSKATVAMHFIRKKHPKFDQMLKSFEDQLLKTTMHTVDSFLIMPVQRLPRYRLLLSDMRKYTPPSMQEYMELERAVAYVDETLKELNSHIAKDGAEQTKKLLMIESSIQGDHSIMKADRKFVREGTLQVKKIKIGDKTNAAKKKVKEKLKGLKAYVFLFNDAIVFCEPLKHAKSDDKCQFSFAHEYPLHDALVLTEKERADKNLEQIANFSIKHVDKKAKDLIIYIHVESDLLVLHAAAADDRESWQKALTSTSSPS